MASNYDKLEELVKTDNLKALSKEHILMAVGRAIQNFEHDVSCLEDNIVMNPDLSKLDRATAFTNLNKECAPVFDFIQDIIDKLNYFKRSYPHPHVLYTMEEEFSPDVRKRMSDFYEIVQNAKIDSTVDQMNQDSVEGS